jgi:hypothetical protein
VIDLGKEVPTLSEEAEILHAEGGQQCRNSRRTYNTWYYLVSVRLAGSFAVDRFAMIVILKNSSYYK